jgi:hypothetical protein
MPTKTHFKCIFCGVSFAALPVTQEPNGAMLLNHLSAMHPDQVGPYLRRMETECITTVVVEAFEVVEQKDDNE